MKKLLTGLFFLGITLTSVTTVLASVYIGLNGGIAVVPDTDVTFSHSHFPEHNDSGDLSWDEGYIISGVVGYGFNAIPVRIEAELFYQKNDADSFSGEPVEEGEESAGFENKGFLVNVYYDFVNKSDFIPYIGAGIGYSKLEGTGGWTEFRAQTTEWSTSTVDDSGLAWQIGAGVAYKFSDHFFIDFKYRYYVTSGFEYTNQDRGTADVATTEFNYESHNFLIGVRYSF